MCFGAWAGYCCLADMALKRMNRRSKGVVVDTTAKGVTGLQTLPLGGFGDDLDKGASRPC